MDKFLSTMPGLVGDIARHVDAQFEQSSPHISIPAALSFVSSIRAGRVECAEGISPNLYCCIVAPSGTGKSQAQQAIQNLAMESDLGPMLMGKPASDSGLLKALQDYNRRFLIWDEFGIALGELSKSQASYRALILSTLMDLFSAAGRTYLGKEYASQPRVDIKEPFLSILAASTPNRFFGALNEDFVCDGFLSRWLLFFEPERRPKKIITTEDRGLPLAEKVREANKPTPPKRGNLAQVFGAERRFIEPASNQPLVKESYREKARASSTEIQRIFWSRAFEQYTKLTLCVTDNSAVQYSDSLYAAELVDELIEAAIKRCENLLYASEREKTKEKFRAALRPGEVLPLAVLTRRTYRLNLSRSERTALIEDLIESGIWIKQAIDAGTGQRRLTCFSAA